VWGWVDDVHEKWNEPTIDGSATRDPTSTDASDASDSADAPDGNEHECGNGNGHGDGDGLRNGHGCNWLRPRSDASDIRYGFSTTQ